VIFNDRAVLTAVNTAARHCRGGLRPVLIAAPRDAPQRGPFCTPIRGADWTPIDRQSEMWAEQGVNLDVSTLADWVGACAATLAPLNEAIQAHVFVAERIHADDTTVPVLAKNKTRTGRLWTYVRDDRPFGGQAPPAATFFYSPDRGGEHPMIHLAGWAGVMQADAYAGYGELYDAARKPAPIIEAACWSRARRKFFELATLKKAPVAIEAVRRIDELFAIERKINGVSAAARFTERHKRSAPLVENLKSWLTGERAKLSSKNPVAKAMDYSLKRWPAMTLFLTAGRVCLSNSAAERALRGVAVGRHNWTFAGSDRGGERAAAIHTLIETCKMNGVDPSPMSSDAFQATQQAGLPSSCLGTGKNQPSWRKPLEQLYPGPWRMLTHQS
jgi:transposase